MLIVGKVKTKIKYPALQKYRNFTEFPGVEILWKGTVLIHQKLCGNCAFLQNFHTRKLGEIAVFFAVQLNLKAACAKRGTIFQKPF